MCCLDPHWLVDLGVCSTTRESRPRCSAVTGNVAKAMLVLMHTGFSELMQAVPKRAFQTLITAALLMPGGVALLPGSAVRVDVKTGGQGGKNKTELF